jgi:transposase
MGHDVQVVNPASIPVERQAKRAKTDRLDALRLVSCLRGWLRGERDRMRPVRIPSKRAEGLRHLARERGQLQKEVCQHRDRIRKLLRTDGCWTAVAATFGERLAAGDVKCHDGTPLPEALRNRLTHECDRLALVSAQLKALEASCIKQVPAEVAVNMERLQKLRGIGRVGAFRLILELFWRTFQNRRQVGACLGLVPQPYDSGQSRVDQGISKQGNNRVRALSIEMAWMWVKHQPKSELTQWFLRRTDGPGIPGTGKRGRRIMIVAVARRLMIELWHYVQHGVLPKGCELKLASRRRA